LQENGTPGKKKGYTTGGGAWKKKRSSYFKEKGGEEVPLEVRVLESPFMRNTKEKGPGEIYTGEK